MCINDIKEKVFKQGPGYGVLCSFLGAVLAIWIVYWVACNFLITNCSESASKIDETCKDFVSAWERRAQFGDMFGGVNALFSALAFAGLIYTVLLQRHELSLQRSELKRATDAAEASHLAFVEQLRAQREANMLNSLNDVDDKWRSKEMKDARTLLCKKKVNNDRSISASDALVLSFFEKLGLYLKRKVFSEDIVWELYSYYILNYWALVQPLVMEYRRIERDDTWYSLFEFLEKAMQDESKLRGLDSYVVTYEQLRRFTIGEMKVAHHESTQER